MGRACSMNGALKNVYKTLAGNTKGKRTLGRPRHRWMNIKMDKMKWFGLE
jgi:hypothetical protein